MKLLHTKTLKDGRRHLLIEIPKGKSELLYIPEGSFFKLGYPCEDTVVQSHHLKDVQRVCWDAYSQKWEVA